MWPALTALSTWLWPPTTAISNADRDLTPVYDAITTVSFNSTPLVEQQPGLRSSNKRIYGDSRCCFGDNSYSEPSEAPTSPANKYPRTETLSVSGEKSSSYHHPTDPETDREARRQTDSLVTTATHRGSTVHQGMFSNLFAPIDSESTTGPMACMGRGGQSIDRHYAIGCLPPRTREGRSLLRFPPSECHPLQPVQGGDTSRRGTSRERHQAKSSSLPEWIFQDLATRDASGIFSSAASSGPSRGGRVTESEKIIQLIEAVEVAEDHHLRSSVHSESNIRGDANVSSVSSHLPSNNYSSYSTPSAAPYNFRHSERRQQQSYQQQHFHLDWTSVGLLQSVLQIENIRTHDWIPPYVRDRVTLTFYRHLLQIKNNPDSLQSWIELFIFPRAVLRCWSTGDPRYKLGRRKRQRAECVSIITALEAWKIGGESRDSLVREILATAPPLPRRECSDAYLAQVCRRRCLKFARESGQYGKAVQALTSHGVADCDEETIQILRDKHPHGSLPRMPVISAEDGDIAPFTVTKEEVQTALNSFPKGTACGRSGLRAAHLLDMLSFPGFAEVLTDVVNIMAAGKAPAALAPLLASAPLVPLKKKIAGIRPVAVGEILRRLVSKLGLSKVRQKAAEVLSPLQVGVGVRHGAEATIHGFNRALYDEELTPHESALVLVDFENAFNMVSRQAFIDAVYEFFPQLAKWVFYTYGCAAVLFCGRQIIHASCGVQQGDPLGPLLFCLVLQPLLKQLTEIISINKESKLPERSPQVVSYLDDVTILAPSRESAKRCLELIRDAGLPLGLRISPKKSLVWQPRGGLSKDKLGTMFKGLAVPHDKAGVALLGGSITTDKLYASEVACDRVNKCAEGLRALEVLIDDPQVSLLLLRACLGMVKLNYCWRTTHPDFLVEATTQFTSKLDRALKIIVIGKSSKKFGDFQFKYASLPIRIGGLGITLPVDLLNFAFLSSARDSSALQAKMFPTLQDNNDSLLPLLQRFSNNLLSAQKTNFTTAYSRVDQLPLHKTQNFLAAFHFKSKRDGLLNHDYLKNTPENQQFSTQHNYILQATYAEKDTLASQWLLAMPNPGLGQVMDGFEFRAALWLRLLIRFADKERDCPNGGRCRFKLDPFGYHALSCIGTNSQTFARHKLLQQSLYGFGHAAGVNIKEDGPVTCLGETRRNGAISRQRPADLLIEEGAVHTCIDVTVVSPLSAAKSKTQEGKQLRALVNKTAADKCSKHKPPCHSAGKEFIAFAVDVCGMVEDSGARWLENLATFYSKRTSRSFPYALSLCRRRVSLAIQLGVARQLRPSLFQPGVTSSEDIGIDL